MASGNFESIFNTFVSESNGTKIDNYENYREICSFLTVQSNSKGFFREFYLEVRDLFVKEGKLNDFGKLASNRERISLLFNDESIRSLLLGILENVKPVFKVKDFQSSEDCRMDGEKLFLLGHVGNVKDRDKLEKALRLTNIAVMRAPVKGDDGKALATTLISRGHILLALDNGIAALNDFKFAADVNPNAKNTSDYYALLARCYLYTDDLSRAEISLNIAEKLSNGGNSETQLCREEMLKYRNTIKEEANGDAALTLPVYTPTLAKGEHAEWKGASSLLKLTESDKHGRFMVAGSNISTGDVVLYEEPLAAYLLHTYFGSYCHHCFEKLIVPLPCLNCSGVAFCSLKCMRTSCDTYHRYECEYMDLLIGCSGMSILCFLALKIFTQSPSIDEALQVSTSLYNDLCGHLNERTVDDHLQRSLMATFLMRCLQKSGYFGQRKTEDAKPSELELKVCVNLYGLLQVLQYNAHEIHCNHCDDDHIVNNSRIVYIGAGIYRTGAYFNHECWPTVARHFYGARLTLTAVKPHAPGDVIAENYGPIFTKQDLKQRQDTLKARYAFDCNCLPCIKKWPLLEKLQNRVRWRCSTPNCTNTFTLSKGNEFQTDTCTMCRKKLNFTTNLIMMEKVEDWYTQAAECMVEQKINRAMELFKTALDAFFDIAVLPHQNTILAQLSFIKCLSVSQIQMSLMK